MSTRTEANEIFTEHSDIFDERYYVWNKWTLYLVGQWPYQTFRVRLIRSILYVMLTSTLLVPQVLKLLNSTDDIDVFIECLSPLLTNVGATVKLANLVCNTKKLRCLLDETRDNWKSIGRYAAEYKILQEYGEKGRFYTISYMTLINSIVAAWCATPLLTVVLDYFIPLNESRPHLVLFQTDYKVDPDKYFYPILLHGTLVCFGGIQMFVANDTLYMVLAQHACGMIEVLRYRLENLTQSNEISTSLPNSHLTNNAEYQRVVGCIKRHSPNIRYIQLIESTCEWCLILVIGLNMLVMSCTGARTVAKGTAPQDVMRFAFFTVAQIVHLFCNTLPGHWIMESSSRIHDSAYNCRWYLISPKSRRAIIFLMSRALKPCTITAGKIYVLSMEGFCAVLRTTMSYFTLLTSMQ